MRRLKKRWSLLWAARFVAKWEGFLRVAYLDTIASPSVWTIGYGHTGDVDPGDSITEARARELLAQDLRSAGAAVNRVCHELGVRPTVRQRIALMSGVYNCGAGILDDPDIREPLRRGNWKAVAREWQDWCHAGGVVVQGLLNRRRSEAWLMLHSARPRRVRRRPDNAPMPKAHHR